MQVRSVLHCLVLLLVAWTPSAALAQSATISGFVSDRSSGQPLELVNVVLRSEDGTVRGATTTQDGLYSITGIDPGRYAIDVSFVGYDTYTDSLTLAPGQSRTLNVALEPTEETLGEVVVETERLTGAARVTAGQQTARPADIDMIPTPDVSGDLAAYLAAQPGIVTTGDRGGQLFIRGGEPSQNLVQLDGILVYQPFHILGFYSAFPSDIINRVDIHAGGYGSKFGGRLSSVIDIAARQGNSRRFGGAVSVSPFISSLLLEGPIYPGRISFLTSVRRSNLAEGAARYVDRPLPFEFGDSFGKLHVVISNNTRATVTGLRTYDRGTLAEETGGAPAEEIRWRNEAVGIRLLALPRFVAVMADANVSFSRLRTELGARGAPSRMSWIENTNVALNVTYFGDRVDTEAGSSLRVSTIQSVLGGLYQNVELRGAGVSHWGSYLEFEFDVGKGFKVRPGVRAQFYTMRFDPFLEPRLRLVWERGVHQVSSAFGLYHQEIFGLSDRRDAASVFTAWVNIPKLNPIIPPEWRNRPQRAIHAILGYQSRPTPWLEFSVEGFYKELINLFVPEWTAFPQLTTRLQAASGRAVGGDLRAELNYQPFYGYVTYGLSSTRYTGHAERFSLWFGDEKLSYRPPHDRRHQINIVAGVNVVGFDVNARWEFGSGLPFSRAIGFDGFAFIDDVEKASETPGVRRVIYERPYNAVLPTYHRLDVSVERTFSVRRADLTIHGSVINTYDRRNLFYLDVFTLRRVDQLPLVPSIGLKVQFM